MKIAFHGAAQCVTGSKHLISLNDGTKILLDCGMFQGMGEETQDLNEHFGFEPSEVTFMVLSHAHIDHAGLIPLLVKKGFRGNIYATSATIALAKILMADSAHIQEADNRWENKKLLKRGLPPVAPMYSKADVEHTLSLFVPVAVQTPTHIQPNVELQLLDSGHIIGAASVHLRITEEGKTTQISFSGDVGRYGDLILKSPKPFPQADYIIVESTYGNRLHKDAQPAEHIIQQVIHETCVERKGKVIIPAFSVGRTQELLYLLNEMYNKGVLPKVKYYVDSPLSAKATEVLKSHPEGFNADVEKVLRTDYDPFDFEGLHYVGDVEESKRLNADESPMVIISASGMAEAGRVKHHIANGISDEKNTVLLVGYCEPRSVGGKLKAGVKEISIFGERHPVNAQISSVQSMSAHADYEDLLAFLKCQAPEKVKQLFLVHGELPVQEDFKVILAQHGFERVSIPAMHESFDV